MVKYAWAVLALLTIHVGSARGQLENTGTLFGGAVEYSVAAEQSGGRIKFVFTNRTSGMLYLQKVDAPWDNESVLKLHFVTDLPSKDEPSRWDEEAYRTGNSHQMLVRGYAIEKGESVSGTVDLGRYYPQVVAVSGRTDVFLHWSMRLRIFHKDPGTMPTKMAEGRESDRFGGFLKVSARTSTVKD